MSTATEIRVKGVESDEELFRANDLLAKTQMPDYWESMEWLERCGPTWPGFHREHTRIALQGDDIVGGLRILTATIRIGRARLRMGGLGWVSTPPHHRNKGICKALVLDSVDYMKRNGYHVSMLFGIPDLYHRYGYAVTMPDHSVWVDVAEVSAAGVDRQASDSYRTRGFQVSDLPAILRVHQANDGDTACSFVRTLAYLKNQARTSARTTAFWADWTKALLVVDRRGNLVAYLVPQTAPDQLHIKELGVTTPASHDVVLRLSAQRARDAGLSRVRFHIPPSHRFARYLERYNSVHETRHFRQREGMMRFCDLESTIEHMLPEWAALLTESALRGRRANVTLVVDRSPYLISWNGDAIRASRVSGKDRLSVSSEELIQVMCGYGHIGDLMECRKTGLSARSRALLSIVFPRRAPFVWPMDHF